MLTTKQRPILRELPTDGPVGVSCACSSCGFRKSHDMYRYLGVVLCGDCRFFARSGRWPHRKPTWSLASWSNFGDLDAFHNAPSVCNRLLEFDVSSPWQAAFLDGWLDVCQLSLQ